MTETRVVPLGGLGEIGLNCLALEAEGGIVLVDCGFMLPPLDYPGVDYLIPEFGYVRERREKLLAVLLTHGHDDHVGAVPHLLQEFPVPVYGTPFTLELLDRRMRELAPSSRKLLRPVSAGGTAEIGPFRAEFLRVTHSVPDSAALALEAPGGTVLCTGDFKLDPSPVDSRPTDEAGLARWGDQGVDLLCCDSTNAARPGHTPSERAAGEGIRRLLPDVAGRVYVATFASHIHRVQQVVEASRGIGRSVTFLGPSLTANVRAARRLGHLKVAPGDLVPAARAAALPPERLTVVVTGLQGEPGSALQRIAHRLDPSYHLLPGDEVFLSGRTIPGCERAVGRLIDLCLAQGARVHSGEEAGIHVSGHPSADDVGRMLDLVRPRHLLPVHGELRHREALAALAVDRGFPKDRVFRTENGRSLLLSEGLVAPGARASTGRIALERGLQLPAGDELLSDRSRLRREGIACAVLWRAAGPGGWEVRVSLRGVFPEAQRSAVEREAEAAVRHHLSSLADGARGAREAEAAAALSLKRHLRRAGGRRPLLEVVAVPGCEAAAG